MTFLKRIVRCACVAEFGSEPDQSAGGRIGTINALLARLAAVALAWPLCAGSASADPAPIEFVGGGYVSDFTNCDGWSGISQVIVRRCTDLELDLCRDGLSDGGITFFFGNYAVHYRFPEVYTTGSWFESTLLSVMGGTANTYQPDPPVRIRITPRGGTVYDSDAGDPMHASFEVENWNGAEGCSARGEYWIRGLGDY